MPAPRAEGPTSECWRYRIAVLLTLGAFNLVTFNRYFPLSEGWWETYGYLYNSGLRPYRDFDLAFTPLFTLLNAGLLRLFGDSFFALRLFGVGVFLAAVLVLELLLERFFSAKNAAVAVTVATFFVISETQFIAKDYHLHQLLLVALSLLLHVELAGNERLSARRRIGGTVLLGMSVSLVFFLKQNVGGLLLVAIPAGIALVERERPIARVSAFVLGAAIAVLLMLPVVSPSDWHRLLLANDAKGSLGTVLGRVWRNEMNRHALTLALKMGTVYATVYALARYVFAPPRSWKVWSDPVESLRRNPVVRRAVFVGVLVLVAVSGHRIRLALTPWILPATLALLGIAACRVARGMVGGGREVDPRMAAMVLPAMALAYANTTTAAFDFNGMHVLVALAIGWILAALEAWERPRYWAVAALAFLVIVPEIVAAKLRVPYEWWGHRQGSVFSAVEECDYPQLRGMYVTPLYRDALNTIKRSVDTYSRSRSDVFFYDLPVFYWFHRKLPPHRTVVQWFDVVSSRQLEADLRALREEPPRLVVALEAMPAAYAGHRQLKGAERLPQEDFRELMDDWVESGKYRLIRSIALPNGTLAGCDVTQDVLVQNERSIGLPLDEILGGAGAAPGELRVNRVARGETRVAEGSRLEAGDVVTVGGDYARVQALSERLGIARGEPRDWHTVNIYVRKGAAATEADGP